MKQRFLFWLGIHFGKWVIKFLYGTNRWAIHGSHHLEDLLEEGKSVIVVTWHGHLLSIVSALEGRQYYGLAGTHADAELISQIASRMGWKLLRGSSTERGIVAYKEILRVLRQHGSVLFITPDGPKGPPRIPKGGVIRAAQKLGVPVIPVAAQSTRYWGFTNWDTFFVAKPFGRISMMYGEPLYFPKSEDLETGSKRLKTALDRLDLEVQANVQS